MGWVADMRRGDLEREARWQWRVEREARLQCEQRAGGLYELGSSAAACGSESRCGDRTC